MVSKWPAQDRLVNSDVYFCQLFEMRMQHDKTYIVDGGHFVDI